jgi:FkbM family methyltransferase
MVSETVVVASVVGPLVVPTGEAHYYTGGEDKDEERALFTAVLKPGDTCVDVGCNVGFFSCCFADLVGPTGQVVAIDPNPQVVACLEETVRQRGLEQITVLEAAAGEHAGRGRFVPDPGGSGTGVVLIDASGETAVVSLDALPGLRRPVRAIKIDAEGGDSEVLAGAVRILGEDRPLVSCEWNPEQIRHRGGDPAVVGQRLRTLAGEVRYRLADVTRTALAADQDPHTWPIQLTFVPIVDALEESHAC